jgi:hypothetical protein
LFQSVVLLPRRVMVKPATVTLLAVTCTVVPLPPMGPRMLVEPAPAPIRRRSLLLTFTSSS